MITAMKNSDNSRLYAVKNRENFVRKIGNIFTI
jgi:hypothetical protein